MRYSKFLVVIAGLYVALLLLWGHLNRTVGDSVWWMALLNYGAPYLFLPALSLAVLAALIPHPRRRFNILFTLGVPKSKCRPWPHSNDNSKQSIHARSTVHLTLMGLQRFSVAILFAKPE